MLAASLAVFGTTVLFGVILVMLHALQRWRAASRVGLLHGGLGLLGLVLLVLSLRAASPRGVADGAGPFGEWAAIFLGLAFLAGVSIWRGRRKRLGDPTLLIGLHATLAIFGVVILAAYFAAPS